MRGIDDEPGISSRSTVPDPVVLKQNDTGVGRKFTQTARSSQTADTRANDDPLGGQMALETIGRFWFRQNCVPSGRLSRIGKKRIAVRNCSSLLLAHFEKSAHISKGSYRKLVAAFRGATATQVAYPLQRR